MTKWRSGSIISMLVVGVLCIPAFIVWEKRFAKRPVVPLHVSLSSLELIEAPANPLLTRLPLSFSILVPRPQLLKDRTVLGCFTIACLLNCSWYLQGDYLYTVLIVSSVFRLSRIDAKKMRTRADFPVASYPWPLFSSPQRSPSMSPSSLQLESALCIPSPRSSSESPSDSSFDTFEGSSPSCS